MNALENWEEILEKADLPEKGQKVYIWGAGNTAVLAHQGMVREGLYNFFCIAGYLDQKNDGGTINGFPVYHPSILFKQKKADIFVLICTNNKWMYQEIHETLKQHEIKSCLLDTAIIALKQGYFRKVISLLDKKSQYIYQRLLYKRMTLDLIEEDLYAGESYFGIPEFCVSRADDVVLDCGAYVGDSVERYLWRMELYAKIIAVEPDLGNFNALNRRVKRLREEWNLKEDRIICIRAGLDDKTNEKSIQTRVGGLGSIGTEKKQDDSEELVFWSIDQLLEEIGQKGVTFVKADIESYEYRMLLGAKRTIEKQKPRLAICMYHNAVDMYSIPQLIHKLNPEYRFAVRHCSSS